MADKLSDRPLTENYIFSVVSARGHFDVGDGGFWQFPAVRQRSFGLAGRVDHSAEDKSRRGWLGVV